MVYKVGILGEPDNLNPLAGWFKDIGLRIELSTVDDGALTDQMYATRNGELNLDYDMFFVEQNRTINPTARKAILPALRQRRERELPGDRAEDGDGE